MRKMGRVGGLMVYGSRMDGKFGWGPNTQINGCVDRWKMGGWANSLWVR